MIVAIHAIALNEAAHVDRFMDSVEGADFVIVGDTGSDDGTPEELRSRGADVYRLQVSPWRFDDARNAAWAHIPPEVDVVVKLDLDEVLAPGWRDALEKTWAETKTNVFRFTYRFVWSWRPDGQPDVQFNADSVVSRYGWRWTSPCHETLSTSFAHDTIHVPDFEIHHLPDDAKSRSSYLGLLATGVGEDPHDDRLAHYYARELYFRGDWSSARREFMRHLNLPSATWPAERAASWRYIAAMDDDPERWLLRALAEDTGRRESWAALAEHYADRGMAKEAYGAVTRALQITGRPMDYMTSAAIWDDDWPARVQERWVAARS